MSSKKRRTYSEDFKKQMVSLYESGKSPAELIEEYVLLSYSMMSRNDHKLDKEFIKQMIKELEKSKDDFVLGKLEDSKEDLKHFIGFK